MKRLKIFILAVLTGIMCAQATTVERQGRTVIIRPDNGQARVVCLEVVNDGIIRVRATSKEALPQKPKSLIIVPQTAAPQYEVTEDAEHVYVKAAQVQAVVSRRTGRPYCVNLIKARSSGITPCRNANWDFVVDQP